MEGIWDIVRDDRTVGTAHICREGLYWYIRCSCSAIPAGIIRLVISCGGQSAELGVLAPEGGGMALEKRIPVKKLGPGKPVISVQEPKRPEEGRFIPVRENAPFPALEQLMSGKFACRDGIPGVLLPKE